MKDIGVNLDDKRSGSSRFMLTLEAGLREEVDAYISEVNRRIFPAELTPTRLINTALRAYLAAHALQEEQTAKVA